MGIGQLAWGLLGWWILLAGSAAAEARNPSQYVFVVDVSASMIGREDGRTVVFPLVQRELMRFAERVADETEVRLVPFSKEPLGAVRFVLPREREEMLRYIRSLRAEGSASHIFGSLKQVYGELCNEPRAFFLFTDGLDNSAEPGQMPELKSQCPLTLVALAVLPKAFSEAWGGLRQNSLTGEPSRPPQTNPTAPEKQASSEAPSTPVTPADPSSPAGPVLAGVQKEYGEESGPKPAPAPPPANPETRPAPPQPRPAPPTPQAQPRPKPAVPAPSAQPPSVPTPPARPPAAPTPSARPPAAPAPSRPAPSPAPGQPVEPTKPLPSTPPAVAPPTPPAKPTPPPIAVPTPPPPRPPNLPSTGCKRWAPPAWWMGQWWWCTASRVAPKPPCPSSSASKKSPRFCA